MADALPSRLPGESIVTPSAHQHLFYSRSDLGYLSELKTIIFREEGAKVPLRQYGETVRLSELKTGPIREECARSSATAVR